MREEFEHIRDNYLTAKLDKFNEHPVAQFLRQEARDAVRHSLGSNAVGLSFKGSSGLTTWGTVPWIAVFDPIVTTGAQRGHYIVYLFSADMQRLYLSLNQGTTAVRKEFGPGALDELRRRAELLRSRVPERIGQFDDGPIDLVSNRPLPLGYEAGHAFGLRYDLDDLPSSETLASNLRQLTELYLVATSRGGTDSSEDISEEELDAGAETIREKRRYRYHRRIERDSSAGKKAKKHQGYVCKACDFDFEKRYGPLGEKFIEAHHLTPLSELPEGKTVSLDPETDFAVLCANCHRMIHRKDAPKDLAAFRELVQTLIQ